MAKTKLIFWVLSIAFLFNPIQSARILGLFPTHSRSHFIIHSAVVEALAHRGHDVTVVTNHLPHKENLPYRYIYVKVPPISTTVFAEGINDRPHFYKSITSFIDLAAGISNSTLHDPSMQKLMREESFDLVLHGYLFNEFLFGVAAHFKCPIVLSFSLRPTTNLNDLIGNPQEYSYVPTLATNAKQPIGFLERVENFIYVTVGRELAYRPYLRMTQETYYSANFPSDKYPSLEAMMKNVSLILTAHHFSQGPIRPDVPAIVEIGGIQIKDKPDPLPEDIQSILDNSTEHGAIYFSLGTNIYSSHLDPSKVIAIFKVLSELPQTVLCKWSDDEVPLKSPNIVYKKWLPQDDVLSHRNLKLFITHGGLGGVTEAQYHGVPMVGIPLLNDQPVNMENVVNSGFGLSLDYLNLSEKSFRDAVLKVLHNPKYSESIKRFSRLYRDRPMTAKDTAVYWVEYVLRHRGASHLQSPAIHMNVFQLLSLDVIIFLLVVLYVIFKAFKVVFSFVSKCCWKLKFKEE